MESKMQEKYSNFYSQCISIHIAYLLHLNLPKWHKQWNPIIKITRSRGQIVLHSEVVLFLTKLSTGWCIIV